LINVHEIILGSQAWQWEGILVLGHGGMVVTPVTIDRNERWGGVDVFRKTAPLDGDSLQRHQPLAHLRVGGWVDLSAFGVAKEFVQGIIVALSGIISGVLANISSVTDWVVDRSVRSGLLRGVIGVVS